MSVIDSTLTVREAIVWEWITVSRSFSRTHDDRLLWVATQLDISEHRVQQLLWSAEAKLSKRFHDIEQNDPEINP